MYSFLFFLEERCEPSNPLNRNTGANRFCPDINTWKEFDQYEIGDGHSASSGTSSSYDRNRMNMITREGDRRMRPPPINPDY